MYRPYLYFTISSRSGRTQWSSHHAITDLLSHFPYWNAVYNIIWLIFLSQFHSIEKTCIISVTVSARIGWKWSIIDYVLHIIIKLCIHQTSFNHKLMNQTRLKSAMRPRSTWYQYLLSTEDSIAVTMWNIMSILDYWTEIHKTLPC